MDMNELYAVIDSMKTVIDTLMDEVKTLSKRQSDLEHSFCDDIIGSMEKALDDINFKEFKERCNGALDKYIDFTKAQNGQDFDIYRQAFDGLTEINKGNDEPVSEADYVEATAKNIEEDIATLQNIIGAEKVTVEQTEEGTTIKAEVDGETVEGETVEEVIEKAEEIAEEPAEPEAEETVEKTEETEEEKPAEEPDLNVDGEEEVEAEEPAEETQEEIDEDLKLLEEEMKKYR